MRSCLNTYSKEEIQSLLLYVSQNIGPIQHVSKVSQGNNYPEFLLISAKLKTDTPLDLKTAQLKSDASSPEDEPAVYVCITAGLGALATQIIPFDKNAPIKLTTLSNNQALYSDVNKSQVNDSISFENVIFEHDDALFNEKTELTALSKDTALNPSNKDTAYSTEAILSTKAAFNLLNKEATVTEKESMNEKNELMNDKKALSEEDKGTLERSDSACTLASADIKTAPTKDQISPQIVSDKAETQTSAPNDSEQADIVSKVDIVNIVGSTDTTVDIVNMVGLADSANAGSEFMNAPEVMTGSEFSDAPQASNTFAPAACDSSNALAQTSSHHSNQTLDKSGSAQRNATACNTSKQHSSFLSGVMHKQHQATQHTLTLLEHKNELQHEPLDCISLWTDQVISQACQALPAVDNTAIFQTLLKYAGLYDVDFAGLQTKAATLKTELTPEYVKAVGSANAEIDKYLQYAQQDNQLLVHKLQNSLDFELPFFMLSAPDVYLINAQSTVKPINFAIYQESTKVCASQQQLLNKQHLSNSFNALSNDFTYEQSTEPTLLQSPWCLNLRNLLTAAVLVFYPQLSWRLACCAASDVPFCFMTGSSTDKKLLANHICLSYFLKMQELKLNPQQSAWHSLMQLHESIDPAQNACLEFSLMLLDLVRLADSKVSPNSHLTTFCEFWFALDRIVRINSLQRRISGKNALTSTFLIPCMSSRKITSQQQGLLTQPNLLCTHQHFVQQQPLQENSETLLYPAPDQPSLALTLAQLIKNHWPLSSSSLFGDEPIKATAHTSDQKASEQTADTSASTEHQPAINEQVVAVDAQAISEQVVNELLVTALRQYAGLFMHRRRALPLEKILNCLQDSSLLANIQTHSDSGAPTNTQEPTASAISSDASSGLPQVMSSDVSNADSALNSSRVSSVDSSVDSSIGSSGVSAVNSSRESSGITPVAVSVDASLASSVEPSILKTNSTDNFGEKSDIKSDRNSDVDSNTLLSQTNLSQTDQDQPKKVVFKINSSAITYDPADCVQTWQIASRLELPEWITLSLRRSAFEMQETAQILEQTLLYALQKLQHLKLSYVSGQPQIDLYDINQIMLQSIRYMQHKLDLCAKKSHYTEQNLNLFALTQSNQPKQLLTEDRELDTNQKLAYTQKILAALQQRITEKNPNTAAGAMFNELSSRLQNMSSKLSRLTKQISKEQQPSQNETASDGATKQTISTQATLNSPQSGQESQPEQTSQVAQDFLNAQDSQNNQLDKADSSSTQDSQANLSDKAANLAQDQVHAQSTELASDQIELQPIADKQQDLKTITQVTDIGNQAQDNASQSHDIGNQASNSANSAPNNVVQMPDATNPARSTAALTPKADTSSHGTAQAPDNADLAPDTFNQTASNAVFSSGHKDLATQAAFSQVTVSEHQSQSAQNSSTPNSLTSTVPEVFDGEFQVTSQSVNQAQYQASYQLIYADQTKASPLHGELIFTLNQQPDLNAPHMKWLNRILLNLTIMVRNGKHFKFGQSFKFQKPIGDFVGATLIQPQLSNKPYLIKLSDKRTIELQQLWPLTADEFDFLQKQGIYPLLLHCMGNPIVLQQHRRPMLNGELNPAQYAAMVVDDVQRHLQAVKQLQLQTEPLAPYSHMAIFLRWSIRRGLISSEFSQRYPQIVEHAFNDLNASHMREYLKGLLQGRLMIWDFSPESHAFIRHYYSGGMNIPSYPSDIDNYALEYFGPQEYTNPQMCDNAYLFVPFDQKYINTVTQNIQLAFSLFMHKHKAQTEAAKTKEAAPTAQIFSNTDKNAVPLYAKQLFDFWKTSWKHYTTTASPSEISIDYAYHFRRSLTKKFYPVLVHINQHWPQLPDFPVSALSSKYMPESQILQCARSMLHLDLSYADLKRCLYVPQSDAINQEFKFYGLLFEQWLQQLPRKFALGYLGLSEDYYEEQVNIILLCQSFILAQALPLSNNLAISRQSTLASSSHTSMAHSQQPKSEVKQQSLEVSHQSKLMTIDQPNLVSSHQPNSVVNQQPNLVLNAQSCVYLKALLPDPLEEQLHQINQACQVLTANLQYLQQERSLISAQEYRTYVQLTTTKLELCLKLKQHLEQTLHISGDRYTMFFKYQSLEHTCSTLDDWASHMLIEQETFAGQTLYIGWILQLIKALSSYMHDQNPKYLPQIIQAAFKLCQMRHAYNDQLHVPKSELFPQLSACFKHEAHHEFTASTGYLNQIQPLPQSKLIMLLKHRIAFDKILDSQPLLKTSLTDLSKFIQQRPQNNTGNLLQNYLWQVFTAICIQKVKLIALKFKIKPEFLSLPELDLQDLKLPKKQYASSSKMLNALTFGCRAVRWQNFLSSQPQYELKHLLLDLPQDKLITALCHRFKLPYAATGSLFSVNPLSAVDSLSTAETLSTPNSASPAKTLTPNTSVTTVISSDRATMNKAQDNVFKKEQDSGNGKQDTLNSCLQFVDSSAQPTTNTLSQKSDNSSDVGLSAIPFTQWQSSCGEPECFVLSNVRKDDCVMTNACDMQYSCDIEDDCDINNFRADTQPNSVDTNVLAKHNASLTAENKVSLATKPATHQVDALNQPDIAHQTFGENKTHQAYIGHEENQAFTENQAEQTYTKNKATQAFSGNQSDAACKYTHQSYGIHNSDGELKHSRCSIKQLALDPSTACMYYWPVDQGLPEEPILQSALTCDYMVFKPLNFGSMPLLFNNQLAEISLVPQPDLALQQAQLQAALCTTFTKSDVSNTSSHCPFDTSFIKSSPSDVIYSSQLLKNDDEFIQEGSIFKEQSNNSPIDFSHLKRSRWLTELDKLLAKSKNNTESINLAENWQRYYTDLNESIVDFKSLDNSFKEAKTALLNNFKDISIINKQLSAWENPNTITELLGKYPMLSLLNRPQVLKNLNLENYWSDLLSLRQIEVLKAGKNWKADVIGAATSSSFYEQKFEPWQTTELGSQDVYLIDFPVTQAWHVWLFLGHGLWNQYVDELMWLMLNREWQEKYQAMPAEVGEDWVRWKLNTPLNLEQANLVAKQMFCACPDMLQQGTLSQWTAFLTESKEWVLRWRHV